MFNFNRARTTTRPEFGTNTGRQGTFDPRDPGQATQALQRLSSLRQNYGERLRPNFTGETGLARNDSRGWSRMLNAQTEAQNIQRLLKGQGPLGVEYGGSTGLPRLDEIPSTVWQEGQEAITADQSGRGRYVTVPSLAGLDRTATRQGAAPSRTRRRR